MIDVDVAVIGGGPAGIAAARAAVHEGLAVALVHAEPLGGRALLGGAIARAAVLTEAKRSPGQAFGALASYAANLASAYAERAALTLDDAGVTLVHGRARFSSARTLACGSTEVAFDRAVIATGVRTRALPGEVSDASRVVTADRFLTVKALPAEALVIGGGTDGVEIVEILLALGVKVTWIMDEVGILPSFDRELAESVGDVLMERGVKLVHGKAVSELGADSSQALAKLDGGRTYAAPLAIVAAGDRPNLDELGLEVLGADVIAADAHGRTSVEHVYAAGEVTGKCHGAAGAEAFGRIAGRTAAGVPCDAFDATLVPRVASTDPEVAQVGLTPDVVAGREVAIHTLRLEETIAGQLAGIGESARAKGVVRVVSASDDGRVLGATALGPGARETVSAVALALRLRATDAQLGDVFASVPSALDALFRSAR